MRITELTKTRARGALRSLQGEKGIVLPLSIALLAVILILTLTVVKASTDANTIANKQVYGDKALATAEAGLQTAYHRVIAASAEGKLKPGYCFTNESKTQELPSETEGCKEAENGETESGAKYTYYVEPLTSKTSANCVGPTATSNSTLLSQSCITASATVNNVTRRVQERIVGAPEKVTAGLESLGKIKINNAKREKGSFRGNGEVEIGSPTLENGEVVGKPAGKHYTCVKECVYKEEANAVNGGNTKPNVELGPAEKRASAYEAAALKGNNKADSEKFKKEVGTAYTEATRIFGSSAILGEAKKPIVLESGVYNFCEVNFTQKVFLEVPKGAEVTIYIDSPERPGLEKCAKEGKFKATNGFCVKNANHVSSALKINFWGNNPGTGKLSEFAFTNNVGECEPLVANVYGPYTDFELTNGGTVTGVWFMGEVLATNGLELGTEGTATTWDSWGPSAWTICKRKASGKNPASCT
jgi:Tfp pilus assembly protein PilX